jgi:hypothetical protein
MLALVGDFAAPFVDPGGREGEAAKNYIARGSSTSWRLND